MNLYDIPALAPYFFERPDLGSMEANSLLKNIPEKHYRSSAFVFLGFFFLITKVCFV